MDNTGKPDSDIRDFIESEDKVDTYSTEATDRLSETMSTTPTEIDTCLNGSMVNNADPEKFCPLTLAIVNELKTIFDPEIPVNIYDLGLIYEVNIKEGGFIDIKMTLTTPACPVAQTFPATIEEQIQGIEGVESVVVEVVWDPPWTPDAMSDEARLQMHMYGM